LAGRQPSPLRISAICAQPWPARRSSAARGGQFGVGAGRRQPRDRPRHFMHRPGAAMPMTFDANSFRAADDFDQNPFEQQTNDGLALKLACAFGAPQLRQILRQFTNRREFSHIWRLRACALDAFILRLQSRLFRQGFFPVAFERSRHQTVFRLDGAILPAGAVDFIARPFQSLTPMTVQRIAVGFEISGERQARLDRCWFQGFDHKARDQTVQWH
jgi:hypothetical protein